MTVSPMAKRGTGAAGRGRRAHRLRRPSSWPWRSPATRRSGWPCGCWHSDKMCASAEGSVRRHAIARTAQAVRANTTPLIKVQRLLMHWLWRPDACIIGPPCMSTSVGAARSARWPQMAVLRANGKCLPYYHSSLLHHCCMCMVARYMYLPQMKFCGTRRSPMVNAYPIPYYHGSLMHQRTEHTEESVSHKP